MKKFEYTKTMSGKANNLEKVNELGKEGWEVINIIHTSLPAANDTLFTFYLKREIPEELKELERDETVYGPENNTSKTYQEGKEKR